MSSMDVGDEMLGWAKELFPICRSLTGAGVRQTLDYFRDLNPELAPLSFKTGEKVFDWEVPQEWNVSDAYIEHESGERFAQFKVSNLHLVGYSEPVDYVMERSALLDHIYTLPDDPDKIPYVTSYYHQRWGFCLSENQKQNLPAGQYRVFIDSSLNDGKLDMAHGLIQGKLSRELFFSSYVCHPSMANNELSGPVLLNALMRYVKRQYPESKYSYRFVLLPETIGSIAYLSRFHSILKERVHCGFNLSCTGDERSFSHVQSRFGDNLADLALQSALRGRSNVKTYSFLKRGSDERQYCAPGIDLPVCTFCRSKYGEYPEYHTNADDFKVVTAEGLRGAFEVMRNIVDAFELAERPVSRVLGEPQLGKRGLYPTISMKGSTDDALKRRMDFLAYADGDHTIFDIVNRIDEPLGQLVAEFITLSNAGLIEDAATPLSSTS